MAFANEKTIIDAWWEITAFFGLVVTALMISALMELRFSFRYFCGAFCGVLAFYFAIKAQWLPFLPEFIGYSGFVILISWPLFKKFRGPRGADKI